MKIKMLLFSAVSFGMVTLLFSSSSSKESRKYWPVTVAQVSTTKHTHVRVTGKVTISKREADGDWHIRISDGNAFITAECIPELPCAHPKIGDTVTVDGISREDKEHGWFEVHPVENLSISH
jgi:hypothetical protein